jgi:hypothetical protein
VDVPSGADVVTGAVLTGADVALVGATVVDGAGAGVAVEDAIDVVVASGAMVVGAAVVDLVVRVGASSAPVFIAVPVTQPRADGARTASMCMPSLRRQGWQAVGSSGQR